ncbi:nicotinamide riboside transporter PnuC [Arsukibacterium sp.]|uniref:nicotinamide riboside transporter PnuC n=1 Tax=Arsukibacterium sp. TaxID=1977258 RepID=UPI00299E65FF|nr:nicotinamide riboside transporter PnuC [Arsukibacterium sp.]MDX1538299.1 nicotinamide riboside transporter PnuC [Arsukibacterium sp.]
MIVGVSQINKIDGIWLTLMVLIGSALSAILATTIFDMTVFLSGILCVALIAIGRREGYLIGLYASASYSVLSYNNGLYGEVYLNLFFFVPTGVIGYVMWRRHSLENKTVTMRKLNWLMRFVIAILCVICILGLGLLLGLNAKQNTPFIDAFTNVLSVVATFLMMWRYKEQWLLYIGINIVSIVMWALRALDHSESGDLMVLMWSLFLLNAIFGYWRWHIGANKSAITTIAAKTERAACDVG